MVSLKYLSSHLKTHSEYNVLCLKNEEKLPLRKSYVRETRDFPQITLQHTWRDFLLARLWNGCVCKALEHTFMVWHRSFLFTTICCQMIDWEREAERWTDTWHFVTQHAQQTNCTHMHQIINHTWSRWMQLKLKEISCFILSQFFLTCTL
jgi:hypothetical protein